MPLKLFVWEDFECDYTCGLAMALAENQEQARELIEEKLKYDPSDLRREPKICELDKAIGFVVHGGG